MEKLSVRASADSTCDLSPELLQAYGIETLPLYVVMDGNAYKDGLELTPDELYAKVREAGKIGSTAAINVNEYLTFFTRMKESCDTLIHFTISSEMSSCFQNACIAAEEVGGVYVIDSRNLSTGIGLQVLRACELAQKGMAAEVIVSYVREMAGRVDATFIPESLEFLKMGGRCSAAAALGANLLRLKPCIQVREGKMLVGKKYTGSMENVLSKYVKDRLNKLEDLDLSRVFITHSGMSDPAIIDKVKDAVLAIAPFEDVQITRAGCTVSNHCGPNTLGVLFCKK
ncbi:MAG: DegV family protein [Clostridia bacterium]|nr:DegV family protein [Clostridia bacterium]